MSLRVKAAPWVQAASGNLTVRLFTLATGVMLARALGPAGRGLITLSILWPGMLMSFGSVINTQTCSFFGSRYGANGIRACMQNALINGAALLALAFAIDWFALSSTRPELLRAANIYAVVVPLTIIAGVYYGALLAEGRVGRFWASKVLVTGTTAVVVAVLIATNRLTVEAYAVAAAAGLPLAIIFAARAQSLVARMFVPAPPALRRDVVVYGGKIVVTGLPTQVNYRVDQLLMALLVSPDTIGLYVVAVTWSSAVSVIGTGFGSVVLSQSVRVDPTNGPAVANTLANIRRAGLLLAGVACFAMATAAFGLPLVFGQRFNGAVLPAVLLCVAALVLNLKVLLQDFARGVGQPSLPLGPETIGAIIRVPLLIVLLPALGAVGAAIASIGSYTIVLLLVCVRLVRDMPHVRAADFRPRASDVITLGHIVRELIRTGPSMVRRRVSAETVGGAGSSAPAADASPIVSD